MTKYQKEIEELPEESWMLGRVERFEELLLLSYLEIEQTCFYWQPFYLIVSLGGGDVAQTDISFWRILVDQQ